MTVENKLPDALTLPTKVLPTVPDDDPTSYDLMTLVKKLNQAHRRLHQVVRESGNGVRFRETRDRIYQDL
jgi:hypothetical protein